MRGSRLRWRRIGLHLVGGVAAPALLSLTGASFAAEPALPLAPLHAAPAAAPAAIPALDLQACRQIALERQPALAAARASLSAAVARQEGLEHLRFASLLQRDLPIRRKQAALGVQINQAALNQAERDALHGVTFTYLAAVYAQEQLAVADQGVEDLKSLREIIEGYLKQPVPPASLSERNLGQIDISLLVARGRREEAVEGLQRALSGLREALGVGCDYPLAIADNHLPNVNPPVDKDQIVSLALACRGEMVQASNAAQVTCFEIDAQKATFLLSAKTFAIGSDIHLQPIPQGSHDEGYKPGGIGIEMPATMNGHRSDRVEQARNYHDRAQAVVEKTHNLLALEAEQAYLRWLEASKKLPLFEEAADRSQKTQKDLRAKYNPTVAKVTLDEVLNGGILSIQLRLQANQTRYLQLQALAALERVTAGGFNASLEQK